jgi:hypothetical protein
MDSPEKVIPDYDATARAFLGTYGDKAWLIAVEHLTNEQFLDFAPFWRGVLKALDEVKEEGK